MAITLQPRSVPNPALAEAYVTIDGSRYCLLHLQKFVATYETTTVEIRSIGRATAAHKPSGGNGSWTATVYDCSSIWSNVILDYHKSGAWPYIEIQIVNEDPSSQIGRKTTVYKNITISSSVISQILAAGEENVTEISGAFDDFDIAENYVHLPGEIS